MAGTGAQRLYRAALSGVLAQVELPRKIRHARFLRATEQAGHKLAINVGFDEARGVTELTILATDHPWLLSIIAGACASAGGNIVDAQIYTTTDGRALDTSRSRGNTTATKTRTPRYPDRRDDRGRARRQLRLPKWWRAAPPAQDAAVRVEPEVIINISGRTATPSSKCPASTGRACCTN